MLRSAPSFACARAAHRPLALLAAGLLAVPDVAGGGDKVSLGAHQGGEAWRAASWRAGLSLCRPMTCDGSTSAGHRIRQNVSRAFFKWCVFFEFYRDTVGGGGGQNLRSLTSYLVQQTRICTCWLPPVTNQP